PAPATACPSRQSPNSPGRALPSRQARELLEGQLSARRRQARGGRIASQSPDREQKAAPSPIGVFQDPKFRVRDLTRESEPRPKDQIEILLLDCVCLGRLISGNRNRVTRIRGTVRHLARCVSPT